MPKARPLVASALTAELGCGAKERARSTRQTGRGSMNSSAAWTLPLMFVISVPDASAWWKTTDVVEPKG